MANQRAVTTRLDQLLYMWSRVGLEGPSRFQIRAASPGFLPINAAHTVAAGKLCTYEPPETAEDAPVSFGWANYAERRFVFERRAAGIDAWGRHGGFSAHILAGQRSQLPSSLTATWFEAPFWMVGDDELGERTDLPTVAVDTLKIAQPLKVAHGLQRHFLAAMLASFARGRPIAFVGDHRSVAATMAAVAAKLPTAVLANVTFSSYEAPGAAGGYDIVGVHQANGAPATHTVVFLDDDSDPPAGPALELTDAFLNNIAITDDEITAALKAAAGTKGFSFRRFAQVFVTLRAIGAGTALDARTCATLIAHTDSARLLIADDRARSGLATALAAGHAECWAGLAKVAGALSGAERSRVGVAIAEVVAANSNESDRRAVTAGAIGERAAALSAGMAESFTAEVLSSVDADPTIAGRLDVPMCATALRHAATCATVSTESLEALLERVAPHALKYATADTLPDTWRAELLQRGWRHGIRVPNIVDRLTREGAALSAPLTQRLVRSGELEAFTNDVVRWSSPKVADAVLAQMQHHVTDTRSHVTLLRQTLRLRSSAQQMQLMEQWGTVHGRRSVTGADALWLGQIATATVAVKLRFEVQRSTRDPLDISRGLRRLLDTTAETCSESATWIRIDVDSCAHTWANVGGLIVELPLEQRFVAAALAYHHAASSARGPAELDEMFQRLFAAGEMEPDTPHVLLSAGYRVRYGAPAQLLPWSFSLLLHLAETDKVVNRLCRDETFQRYWSWLATALSPEERERIAAAERRRNPTTKALVRALRQR